MIVVWMVVNTVLLQHVIGRRPFDPYPYIALNLVLSGLAGIQAPIIMMSQNRAAARDEILASPPLRRDSQDRRATRVEYRADPACTRPGAEDPPDDRADLRANTLERHRCLT